MKALLRCFVLAGCLALVSTSAQAGLQFTDITNQAGTILAHDPDGAFAGADPAQNWWGPGVAWVDCNGDGWLDIFAPNGQSGDKLFLNNADGTFTEVAGALGVAGSRVGNGIAAADFDNDGDEDMAVANFLSQPYVYSYGGSNFDETALNAGISPIFSNGIPPEGMGMSLGDIDGNGFVDLYVANHRMQPDVLFRNLGGNTFQRTDDVSATAAAWGFMAVFLDYDDDGDQDIYVANDFGYNYLFENKGPALNYAMVDVAQLRKIAGGGNGQPYSMGMGLAVGDYDNDLDQDIYVTNYGPNALYENQIDTVGRFSQKAETAGVQFNLNCWGVDFCDLDLDGDLDLIQASGYIYAMMTDMMAPQPLDLPNKVWLNNLVQTGQKNFTDVSDAVGFNDRGMGRGLATGDFDRDGDLDVVITNNTMDHPDSLRRYTGHLMLYRNDQDLGNSWVNLRLVGGGVHSAGSGCNRSGVGARVFVTTSGGTQMREVQAGSSYLSQNSLELEFGLGSATSISQVQVRWPCGATENFSGVHPGEFWILEEGAGSARAVPVAFASFAASAERDGVRLEWFTASNDRPVRTRVYRAPADRTDLFHPISVDVDYHDGRGLAFDDGVVAGERYAYRVAIEGPDRDVVYSPVATVRVGGEAPTLARARVGQNYPNPFNPSTMIQFELPRRSSFTLSIFDLRGRLVRELYAGELEAGTHTVEWNGLDDAGRRVASGSYHYVLRTEEGTSSRTMTLVQ